MTTRTHALRRIDEVWKAERGTMLATLIRVLGDFDLAEDALAAAGEAALAQWPDEGVPDNPRAWLIRAARNKAVDDLRHRTVARRKHEEMQSAMVPDDDRVPPPDESEVVVADGDDRLRLMFTCCHPALAQEAQVALTLRTLGGLSTEEIARAFLVPAPTMAQRLVRAKQKIRSARIPYRVPDAGDMPERLASVMAVVYLVFNEGYAATSGDELVRGALVTEALHLGGLLCELVPEASGPRGLLALMMLHDARKDARVTPGGDVVVLDEQDRSRWDHVRIRQAVALLQHALRAGPADAYALQAAIAALHAQAPRAADTDWRQIAGLYARLFSINPSPVVMLNHAVAVAMSDGFDEGLRLMDQLHVSGLLAGYHWLPAARADLLRRLGRRDEASAAYQEALALVGNDAERRFLLRRLRELQPA